MAHRALGVLAANSLVGGRAGSNCKAIFRRSARRRGPPPPPTSYAGDAASWYAAAQPRGSARVRQGRHEMSIKSMPPVSSNQEGNTHMNKHSSETLVHPGARADSVGTVAPETDSRSREKHVWSLARRLHGKMEQLDPTEDDDWENLSERQREFYRLCVESIFDERELSRSALK